jgi:hypothetical protein
LSCIIQRHVCGLIRCITCSRVNREDSFDGGRLRIRRATAIRLAFEHRPNKARPVVVRAHRARDGSARRAPIFPLEANCSIDPGILPPLFMELVQAGQRIVIGRSSSESSTIVSVRSPVGRRGWGSRAKRLFGRIFALALPPPRLIVAGLSVYEPDPVRALEAIAARQRGEALPRGRLEQVHSCSESWT